MKNLVWLLAGVALVGMSPAQGVDFQPSAALFDEDMPDARITNGLMPGGYASHTCGGVAPASNTCTTGPHMRTGPGWFGAGQGAGCSPPPASTCVVALPGYTGTLKMNIVYWLHDSGQFLTRSQVCDVSNGLFLFCQTVGVNPPAMQPFTIVNIYDHTCQSFDLFTTNPGGSGRWDCFTYHNVSPLGLLG